MTPILPVMYVLGMPSKRATRTIPPDAQRLFHCAQCQILAQVCSACDRGHRYCSPQCRRQSRKQQLKDAGRLYQQREQGRQKHAARQRAYRARRQPVEHPTRNEPSPSPQAEPAPARPAVLAEHDVPLAQSPTQQLRELSASVKKGTPCRFCGRTALRLRLPFLSDLRTTPKLRTSRRYRALSTPP